MPTTVTLHTGSPRTSWFEELSPWAAWGARLGLPVPWPGELLHSYPGVYMLAHFPDGPPPGPADYLDPGVVYVGEGGWLRRRWHQFDVAANGGGMHSGGTSYCQEYGAPRPDLFVAALGVWIASNENAPHPEEPWTTFYRLHVERHVIWSIVAARNGQGLTLLNRR